MLLLILQVDKAAFNALHSQDWRCRAFNLSVIEIAVILMAHFEWFQVIDTTVFQLLKIIMMLSAY